MTSNQNDPFPLKPDSISLPTNRGETTRKDSIYPRIDPVTDLSLTEPSLETIRTFMPPPKSKSGRRITKNVGLDQNPSITVFKQLPEYSVRSNNSFLTTTLPSASLPSPITPSQVPRESPSNDEPNLLPSFAILDARVSELQIGLIFHLQLR
ncbi:hypothetical protein K435DRAFT_858560 [Dendrothele bispora CBS 962.96]|uniref:Uncharacterized protein n=1 Tax=Dendrothele bispora (strain CBS 962.96) TaxID=1314807 RepID=A0A4S8M2U6_DENBC|nr:hypothetical protein K435DRAFT_858560 [Dendrothele bispora CBS 962.96]